MFIFYEYDSIEIGDVITSCFPSSIKIIIEEINTWFEEMSNVTFYPNIVEPG